MLNNKEATAGKATSESHHNHVHTHHKYFGIRHEILHKTRIFAVVFYIFNQIVFTLAFDFNHTFVNAMKYLTEWGYLLCFSFTVMLVVTKLDKQPTHKFSHFFHILLAVQFLITGFYWAVIHRTLTFINATELYICYVKHIFPMMHMFFEFLFNNILISRKSLSNFLLFMILYMLYNFTLNRVFDAVVYKMITWRG